MEFSNLQNAGGAFLLQNPAGTAYCIWYHLTRATSLDSWVEESKQNFCKHKFSHLQWSSPTLGLLSSNTGTERQQGWGGVQVRHGKGMGLAPAAVPAKSLPPSQTWSAFTGQLRLAPVISLEQVWVDPWGLSPTRTPLDAKTPPQDAADIMLELLHLRAGS